MLPASNMTHLYRGFLMFQKSRWTSGLLYLVQSAISLTRKGPIAMILAAVESIFLCKAGSGLTGIEVEWKRATAAV